MTTHDWLHSLQFGKRYHKPANMTWHDLEYQVNESMQYRRTFENFRVKKLRGGMFALQCKHCKSTTNL